MNYPFSHLAKHLEGVSHDTVNAYLHREQLASCHLWEQVQSLLKDRPEACLIVDNSVQAKKYAHKIELVKRQYSGNEGGLVKGIRIVNLVRGGGSEYDPIDFRIGAKRDRHERGQSCYR